MISVSLPHLGESTHTATITKWFYTQGDYVVKDAPLLEIETEKVTIEVYAPTSGILQSILKPVLSKVQAPEMVGEIDETAERPLGIKTAPLAQNHPEIILNSNAVNTSPPSTLDTREPFSPLRRHISDNLKNAQNQAAILTTFNEIDLSGILSLRKQYGGAFLKKYGIKLGISSFFVYFLARILLKFPIINSQLSKDQSEIIYKNSYHIGIAIATDLGLVVPVIKNANHLLLDRIERDIQDYANRAKSGHLTPDELRGGTFTITNGGVFGSLLSTPILNYPQAAILGLHKIQERPIAVNSQVVIRPMMYVALSYDHRLIDGEHAVGFLVAVKNHLENPGLDLLGI